jgi:hypothetical protein
MKKLLLQLLVLMLFNGCSAKLYNGVESYNFNYYKKLANESTNIKNIKAFLTENSIRFNTYSIVDDLANGSFGSVLIDGKKWSFAYNETNTWVKDIILDFDNTELASFYFQNKDIDIVKPLKNGKYFYMVSCADLTHAELSQNNEAIVLPFTYLVTAMTKDKIQLTNSLVKNWNCDGYEFGEVIYKKNIRVSSNINSLKSTYEFKKGETILFDYDKLFIITGDAISKASYEKLNDAEMLQAWKDYLVTVNNSTNDVEIKQGIKPIIKEESASEFTGLDDAKNNCKELGFKVGSKEFGNCVLKLAK